MVKRVCDKTVPRARQTRTFQRTTQRSNEMKKHSKQLSSRAMKNQAVGSFISLAGTLGLNAAGDQFARAMAALHHRYRKAQLIAARSETHWTPNTVE